MTAAAAEPRPPVLVELFTSEGCSSCPPADALLAKLDAQSVEGAEVIPLSLHVDYWDRLGWKDPFSSAAFSRRQSEYAGVFGSNRVYTPQMVVDGHAEFVGGDERKARDAIRRAASEPKVAIDVTRIREGVFRVFVPAVGSGPAAVFAALSEDRLSTDVPRGENAGRRLAHTAVVRELVRLGAATPGRPFLVEREIAPPAASKRDGLRLVVFLQEESGRRVLGVRRIPFG